MFGSVRYSLSWRLYSVFAYIMFVLGIVGTVSLVNTTTIYTNNTQDTNAVIRRSIDGAHLREGVLQSQSDGLQFLLAHNQADSDIYHARLNDDLTLVAQTERSLQQETLSSNESLALATFHTRWYAYIQRINMAFDTFAAGDSSGALTIYQLAPYDSAVGAATSFIARVNETLASERAHADSINQLLLISIAAICSASFVLTGIIVWALSRYLLKRIAILRSIVASIAQGTFGIDARPLLHKHPDELEQLIIAFDESSRQLGSLFGMQNALLDNIASDVFLIFTMNGTIVRCNDGIEKVLHFSRAHMQSSRLRVLFPDDTSYADFTAFLQEVIRLGSASCPALIHTAGDRPLHLDCHISWLEREHLFVLIGRDITRADADALTLQILYEISAACGQATTVQDVIEAALDRLWTCLPGLSGAGVVLAPYHGRHVELFESPDRPAWPYLTQVIHEYRTGDVPLRVQCDDQLPSVRYIIPLIAQETSIGYLALEIDQTWWWEAVRSNLAAAEIPAGLESIADTLALSLQRARLYEQARSLAYIDSLTDVSNHRSLQMHLNEALASHVVPLSVIMIDIDHFRHFNERFGHSHGDRVLKQVAQAIQLAVPDGHMVARYGGEEFAVVLAGVNAAGASTIAESIRCAIAVSGEDQDDCSVTASLGHATYPDHASSSSSILRAADLALYRAKQTGRNRVVAYAPLLLDSTSDSNTTAAEQALYGNDVLTLPSGADLEMVWALITAIDLRDGYTATHSDNVARLAVAIGQQLHLPIEAIEALRLGGLIHDVGKIGVPDTILRKPGRLDAEEWTQMQAHPVMGESILRRVAQLHHLLPMVRWHHEKLDGSGYPDGLKGEEIPLLVRILTVADTFDAFTAERPYHPARSASEGLRILQEDVASGRMDADVVAACMRALAAREDDRSLAA